MKHSYPIAVFFEHILASNARDSMTLTKDEIIKYLDELKDAGWDNTKGFILTTTFHHVIFSKTGQLQFVC